MRAGNARVRFAGPVVRPDRQSGAGAGAGAATGPAAGIVALDEARRARHAVRVNINKSTRYGLHAALELALARGESVSVAQVAQRYRIPQTALAKVFQQLVRGGLVRGQRGVGGGYVLARPASSITVLDVIRALQPVGEEKVCSLADAPRADCPASTPCRLRGLFDEVDEQERATFASVTLETLAR